jgi:hypothetical protein
MMKVHEIPMEEDAKSCGSSSRETETNCNSNSQSSSYATTNEDDAGSFEAHHHLSPKSASAIVSNGTADKASIELGQVPDMIADKLFRAYIYHISTRWPALQSPYLRQLHEGRATLMDVFE